MNAKTQFRIALYFFAAIALLGFILRMLPVFPLGINYHNFLHAHSHVAFLGWLHGAFISFVSYVFLKDKLNTKTFKFIYWFTILNVIGMYFSFPIQGYKFFSILFLSLFLIGTYLFLYYFFKHKNNTAQYPATYKFIKAGLWLQFLSSISPWSLGPIIKIFGKQSPFYKYDIFYYLHFQYNGWFLFATIGLTLYLLERRRITLPVSQVSLLYKLMLIAVFLGYFSNVLWSNPGVIFNILALFGGAAEIAAFLVLIKLLYRYHRYLRHTISNFSYYLLKIVLYTFMFKAVLQFMGSFQYYADLSYQIRDFIIGYLHLIMLGIFTTFLIILGFEFKFIKLRRKAFYIFYTGFVVTETLIFFRGLFTWFNIDYNPDIYNWSLFIFTFWMALGIWGLSFFNNYQHEENI